MSAAFSPSPLLIYGTAWKQERTAALVEKAILCGFRGIDTACQPKHYNEAGVGESLQRLEREGITRESLFLQTKFTPLGGQDPYRIPYDPSAPLAKQVSQSFQVSLQNLRVEYIDALLLHSPLPRHEQTMEVWHAMEELYRQGIVHRLGISNCYDLEALQLIFNEAIVRPSLLQNRFYAETGYDNTLRSWCDKNDIRYQSFWTLTANPHILTNPVLLHIALARQVTTEQLFFRFLTQQKITPLIGTCSEIHMKQDLAIFAFTLTDEEMDVIHALLH